MKEHECTKEGEIGVLMDFKNRTEEWVGFIAKSLLVNSVGFVIMLIGLIAILIKLYLLK